MLIALKHLFRLIAIPLLLIAWLIVRLFLLFRKIAGGIRKKADTSAQEVIPSENVEIGNEYQDEVIRARVKVENDLSKVKEANMALIDQAVEEYLAGNQFAINTQMAILKGINEDKIHKLVFDLGVTNLLDKYNIQDKYFVERLAERINIMDLAKTTPPILEQTIPQVETPNDLCLIMEHRVKKQKDHYFNRGNLNMNKSQILILWSGILVIVVLLLFPPWQFVVNISTPVGRHSVSAGPYRLVFLGAPSVPITRTTEYVSSYDGSRSKSYLHDDYEVSLWKTEIDKPRLLIPISIVVIVTIGLLVTFNRKGRKPNNPVQTTSQ
jgi:hypothetical protein